MTAMARAAVATAPTWYPVMIVVVARPLRPERVNSLTMAIAVGRQPPSPSPARKRSTPNTAAFGAKAHSSVKNENAVTAPISALRRPTTSVSVPMVSAPIIIPTRPMVITNVVPAPVSAHSSGRCRVVTTVPTTTRSKPSSSTAIQHSGATQWPPSRRSPRRCLASWVPLGGERGSTPGP